MSIKAFCRRMTIKTLGRRMTVKTLPIYVIFLTVVYFSMKYKWIRANGDFESMSLPLTHEEMLSYEPLYVHHFETFPTSGKVRIPRIIHQTWKDTNVPTRFSKWIQSWLKVNREYKYFLWTDESARHLIKDRHPGLLETYDNYSEGIRRADALRYVVLYEFGGVYADMDVACLQSLDPMLRKYSCFIPQEPWEHPILDKNFKHLPNNAVMGCAPKHPFMKKLIDSLVYFSHMLNVLDSTGPHFVTYVLKIYAEEISFEPTHDIGVYLTPPQYFLPNMSPTKYVAFRALCMHFKTLSQMQKQACVTLKLKGGWRKPSNESFTEHFWVHTYSIFAISWNTLVDIHRLVPKAIIYS